MINEPQKIIKNEIAPPLIDDATASDQELENTEVMKQFVSFTIGEEEYGVDIIFIREIKGWVPVTPLPNSPEYMLGVLNLRGTIVPIFDMRCRFGLGKTEISPLHVMIIVAVDNRIIGILVDAVSDILTIGSNQIMDVPDLDQRGDRKFLRGLITHEDHMVALLSIEELFDTNSITEQLGNLHMQE
jgi:purine-binding chemotaxis protein CheW